MAGKVLTLAQQKGGAGKTTLAAHIAIAAEAGGDGPANIRFFVKHESTKTRKKACVQRHHQILACVLDCVRGTRPRVWRDARVGVTNRQKIRAFVQARRHVLFQFAFFRAFRLS